MHTLSLDLHKEENNIGSERSLLGRRRFLSNWKNVWTVEFTKFYEGHSSTGTNLLYLTCLQNVKYIIFIIKPVYQVMQILRHFFFLIKKLKTVIHLIPKLNVVILLICAINDIAFTLYDYNTVAQLQSIWKYHA